MKTQMDHAYDFLLDGPKTIRHVAEKLGITTKQASQCLTRLRNYGRCEYSGNSRDGVYSIPNHRVLPRHHPRIGIWGL
jgi:hypothetical protein